MIRQNPNGTYSVRVGRHGRQHTAPNKKTAERIERALKEDRAASRAGLEPERKAITFNELVELYESFKGSPSKWRDEMLAYPKARFGKQLVTAIQPESVSAWLHGLKSQRSKTPRPLAPKTKQHILDNTRAVFSYGVELGYLRRSPVRSSAVQVKGGNAASRVFPFESWEEVEQVAAATFRVVDQALVLFIAATGLRPEEALALRWNRIDLGEKEGRVLTVTVDGEEHDAGKTPGALRPFILTQRALDALALLPEPLRRSQLIFPDTRGGLVRLDNWRKRVWHPALDATGLRSRPLYQLRHTFATLALEAGVPIELVSAQLGHTDIRTTLKHYAKFRKASHDRLRSILDAAHETKEETVEVRDSRDAG